VPRGDRRDQARVRPDRRRKKKLTVAFHFQISNQAAWKCDTCRKQGLEKKRRCSWIGPPDPSRVVWARADVRLGTCPKSYITAQSIDWLERYHVQRTFGFGDVMQ